MLFRSHREAEPGRILHALCEGSAIAQCPLRRMVSSGQIVHLALAVGRIARSHQRFSRRGDRLAKQIWLAAGIKRALAAARTVGSQHSGREGTDTNKLQLDRDLPDPRSHHRTGILIPTLDSHIPTSTFHCQGRADSLACYRQAAITKQGSSLQKAFLSGGSGFSAKR